MLQNQSQGHFERVLNRKDILALAFGAMIGWGWVVLAGTWIQSAGAMGAISAFLIGGFAIILIGLTYAELASAMPQVGGEHVYSFRALGIIGSFICTWAVILGYVSVVSFEAVALPTVIEYLFPNYKAIHLWTIAGWDVYLTWALVGIIGSIAMTIINYFGVKTAALLQKVVTVLIMVVGIMLVTGSLFEGSSANMEPLFVDGATGLLAVIVMVPFMFVGFDVIPQAAEEIDLPFQQIGKVLIMSVLLAVAWYALIVMAVALALPAEASASSSLAVADAMGAVFNGSWAAKLIILAGIGGIITSWNAFYIGGSRAIYALAHAKMLPSFLGKLHPKYNTPTNAILLIGFFSALAPLFGRKTLVWLVDAGGLGIVTAYAFVALSFIVLRRREPDMKRPFKVAYGNIVGYTALLLSLGLMVLYMPGSPSALVYPEWLIVVGWTVLGIILYAATRLKHNSAETTHIMEQELKTGHSDLPEDEADYSPQTAPASK